MIQKSYLNQGKSLGYNSAIDVWVQPDMALTSREVWEHTQNGAPLPPGMDMYFNENDYLEAEMSDFNPETHAEFTIFDVMDTARAVTDHKNTLLKEGHQAYQDDLRHRITELSKPKEVETSAAS